MKAKLFIFIGFVAAAIGMSLLFNTAPVHAAGETYRWVNANTIEGSGGSFENLYADGKVTFNRSDGFAVSVENTCINREPFVITITPSQSNRNGSLTTSGCGEEGFSSLDPEAYEFDIAFDIANPENGPPLPGSDIDFMELDCSTYVNRPDLGENFDQERWRCEAMQACIEGGSSQAECLTTWVGCVDERNNSFSCRNDMVENGTNIDLDGEEEDENTTTCAVDGLGWIICPILNFTASLADGAYEIVAGFLEIQPLLTTGTSEPIYQAWSIMRNIANVAFVIAFMIIIFSQITSFGISNYGIKRMLPRLIVAAILVNVSYWICAIAVDVTNILGGSLKQLFDSVGASFEGPDFGTFGGAQTWSNITIGVLSVAVVVATSLYVTLSALIPILITVIAALLTTLIILAVRQALIILLVVISPLAFVAFLLPNTQNLFTSWRNLFQTLLLMFPIIAAIFGASALASQVVTASAQNIDNEALRIVTQIFGAGIASIPLLLTILIPRLAGRLGSFINDPSRGLFDRARKSAEGYRDYRQNIARQRRLEGTNMLRATSDRWKGSGRKFVRGAGKVMGWGATGAGKTGFSSAASFAEGKKLEMEQRRANAEKALTEAKQDYVAERAQNEEYAKKIAGPTGNVERIQAAAITAQKNAVAEAIKNAEVSANIKPGDLGAMAEALKEAIKSGNTVKAQAMQNMMLASGGKGVSSYRNAMQDMESELARQGERLDYNSGVGADLRENMLKNHGGVKKDAADLIAQAASGLDLNQVSNDRSTWQMSDQDFVTQKDASVKIALDNSALGKDQAVRIMSNKNLTKELSEENLARVEAIAQGVVQGSGGDTRATPSPEQLDIAHEEALREERRRNPGP